MAILPITSGLRSALHQLVAERKLDPSEAIVASEAGLADEEALGGHSVSSLVRTIGSRLGRRMLKDRPAADRLGLWRALLELAQAGLELDDPQPELEPPADPSPWATVLVDGTGVTVLDASPSVELFLDGERDVAELLDDDPPGDGLWHWEGRIGREIGVGFYPQGDEGDTFMRSTSWTRTTVRNLLDKLYPDGHPGAPAPTTPSP